MPGVVLRRQRDPAALGLEAEEPAAAGRDADRAAAVGAERAAREAGRDRRRRAAARAARRAVEVPRVAGRAEGRGLGERRDLELGDAGLADDHGAGRAQPAHDLGVLRGRLAERVGAARGHLARDVGVVLDRDRHAEQRAAVAAAAAPVGLGGLGQRALGEHDAERVEARVEPGDPLEVELGELARGQLPRGDQLGLAREAGEDGVGGVGHGGGGYRAWDDRPLPVSAAPTTAEGLCRFEERGPCSDAERRAAAWLHDDLRADGHEAWVETHWVRPQWALSLALHATVGVVASVVALSAPLPAAIAAALAALSMAVEASGRTGPLRLLLPRRATQNVLTVPDEDTAPDVTLLICAPTRRAAGS